MSYLMMLKLKYFISRNLFWFIVFKFETKLIDYVKFTHINKCNVLILKRGEEYSGSVMWIYFTTVNNFYFVTFVNENKSTLNVRINKFNVTLNKILRLTVRYGIFLCWKFITKIDLKILNIKLDRLFQKCILY